MPNVSLYAGEATPSNVVLRSFPLPLPAVVTYDVVLFAEAAAPALAPPVISPVLYAGDASPSTVILRPLSVAGGTLGPVNVILRVAGAAVGPAIINGSLVSTLADLTLVGTGTVTGGGTVTGTLSSVLVDATLSGTGTVIVGGSLAQTLNDLYGVSVGVDPQLIGTVLVSGVLSSTLGSATLAGLGTTLVSGSLSITLGAATLSATGTVASDATGLNVICKVSPLYRKVIVSTVARSIKAQTRMTVKMPVVFGRKVVIAPVKRRLNV